MADVALGETRQFDGREYRLTNITRRPDHNGGGLVLEYVPVVDPQRIEPPRDVVGPW